MDMYMDVGMDVGMGVGVGVELGIDVSAQLTKKTTILFSPDMYGRLAVIAQQRRSSVGQLVRDACRIQYSISSRGEKLAMVKELAALQLPVGTPEEMERESVAEVDPLP